MTHLETRAYETRMVWVSHELCNLTITCYPCAWYLTNHVIDENLKIVRSTRRLRILIAHDWTESKTDGLFLTDWTIMASVTRHENDLLARQFNHSRNFQILHMLDM